ncbi:uncharacterized protein (DUF885 family) [Pacificimonas flava]|uniref:DUF885 domain-containing protein n=2 Tax=Pacificimonas flava TaxID=1234595 RepID=M2TLJ1_9SPHN|nr:hypothetical protein C725_1943 [Pacificimonas flava]MBB5281384.1 uncharacterized protein (DUF885 family) [Pacificimonas flava]
MKHHIFLLSGLVALVSGCGFPMSAVAQSATISAEQPESDADRALQALYEAEWEWSLQEFAEETDENGRSEPTDHLPSVTPEAQARRLAYWTDVLAQLEKIDVDRLSPEERINYAVFRTKIAADANNLRYKRYERPFNSDTFFWGGLNPRTPPSEADEYRKLLGRMRDIPRYFDENIENMRAGLARGFTVPKVSTLGRDETIVPYTDLGSDNPFMKTFMNIPDSVPAAERKRLAAEAEQVVRDIVAPAYAKLLTFMREDYIPSANEDIMAENLPDGPAFYQSQIREYTTLDMTAEDIHELGLKEVARIRADMDATIAETGFDGSFEEFLEFLRTDPQFYAKTPKELLSFSAYVAKRVDGKLKDLFTVLPRYRFTVLPVPDELAPIYTSGRGGLESCLMNTYDLPSRPLYNLTALTLHECVPGHSHQAAMALEAPDRPDFRRQTYFSGYGEGWGLYCEWLGTVLGVYDTPYEEFGRQTFEMWRAARLVIDTGIHHYGWSRQQAIDYLLANTALARIDVENEIDRYIAWPGQALAYKLGEMTIRDLRAKAQAELGDDFDQRPFHDAIINMGSVPLDTLVAEMDRFIQEQKAGADAAP